MKQSKTKREKKKTLDTAVYFRARTKTVTDLNRVADATNTSPAALARAYVEIGVEEAIEDLDAAD